MGKKIVYVLPGDTVELRICDPRFEVGANREGWIASSSPTSFNIGIRDMRSVDIPVHVSVFVAGTNRQVL